MNENDQDPNDIQITCDRIYALARKGASEDAAVLLRDLLFDLRRGRRRVGRSIACRLAAEAFQLDLQSDFDQWARYALGGAESELAIDEELRIRSDLIAMLIDQQRFGDAMEILLPSSRSVAGADPQVLFRFRVGEGVALAKQHLHEEALARYEAAARAGYVDGPGLAVLEMNRGGSLNSLGRNEEAIAAYHRCLQLGAGSWTAVVTGNLANALRDLGRFEEAERYYSEAIELAGEDKRARGITLSNHGLLLIAQGRRDEARAMLQDAALLRGEANDRAGQAITLKELAKVLADDQEYRDSAVVGMHALKLIRAVGLPDDEELVRLIYASARMTEILSSRSELAAHALIYRLRKAGPASWPAIASRASPELLRLAASHLHAELQEPGESDKGRAVEGRWLAELLSGISELGPDLGTAEHGRRMRPRLSAMDIIARLARLDDWLDKKRFYESEQQTLDSPETLDVAYVVESRAGQLHLDSSAVAAVRDLIRNCHERGTDIAFAELPQRYLDELLHRFVEVGSWRESLQIMQAHEQYFSSGDLIQKLTDDAVHASPTARAVLELHIWLLLRCHEVGAERAFAEAAEHHQAFGQKSYEYSVGPGPVHEDAQDAVSRSETEAVRTARKNAENAERIGESRLLQHALLELAQAYLNNRTGDRKENLSLAAQALLKNISTNENTTNRDSFRSLLWFGEIQVEMTRSGEEVQRHLHTGLAAFERALSTAQEAHSPRWTREAAREVFGVATRLGMMSEPPDIRVKLALKRLRACEAAMDATDELMRTGDLDDRVVEQRQALWAYAGAVQELADLDMPAAALIAGERGRARGFLAEIELLDELPADIPTELTERERAARNRLREARRESAGNIGEVRSESADHDLTAVHEELAQYSPEIARLRSAAPPDIDELIILARQIKPKTMIISWYITPNECFAFAISSGTGDVRMARVDLGATRLERFVELASEDIWQRPDRRDQPLSPVWDDLTDSLIPPPWRESLADANRIVLVPHGPLNDLPLHALPLDWLGGRSLLEAAPTEYRPSLTLGHRMRHREPTGVMTVVLAHAGQPPNPDLPSEFELEARSVAATAQPARLLIGPAARVARLTELSSKAAILHVAAHGVFDAVDPLGSEIRLSDGTWTGTESLTPRHVLRHLKLPGTVVVLSGCETGRRSSELTDESEGLVRAFLIAGASAVVASRWMVDSSATRHLMEYFHHRLRETGNVAESLRDAALSLRKVKATSHPYYWAPFISVGT